MALVLGAVGSLASAAEARVVTVRFQQPDATGVTAFRIYVRQAGGSYGSPAWQGLPAPSDGVYSAQVTVADAATSYASGTAVSSSGESALSNEITLAPPAPVCGNAALESPEQCDDGNTAAGDGCRADCTVERCGDARLDPAEQCDDGNTAPGDGCSATCTVERVPACGDAIVDAGEQCDDGNAAAGDGCRANCTVEACGDAIHDPGEACDDGNAAAGDGCRADCTAEACGDGRLDPAEQCDDGGTTAGDGCDAVCRTEAAPVCGDGVPDAGEECDDGNATNGDGCDAQCRTEATSSVLPLFVNVGGPDYADPDGRTWRTDTAFTDDGTPASSSNKISGTNADPMYRSRRYGTDGPLVLELPVEEEGLYYVRLHFAEVGNEVSRAGERVFDVQLEGSLRIEDVDVMALVGKRRAATRVRTIWVTDGVLTIELLPQTGRPMLSGVELHRAEDAPTTLPSPAAPKIVGAAGVVLE